jgi:ATP-dependent Lhr-like helicase
MLSLPLNRKVNIWNVLNSITEENCEEILKKAVENTHLLKSLFRVNACRSFMILRNYMGRRKSARKQQVSADMLIYFARKLDNFAILNESYREIIQDKFEVENTKEILRGIQSEDIELVMKSVDTPSPMAFGIASVGASDVVFVDDKLALLKEFQRRVMDEIEAKNIGRDKALEDRIGDKIEPDKAAGEGMA